MRQDSGAWPYAGLSSLKVKENLIVIQMVQTLYTSAKKVTHLHTQKCTHNVSPQITLVSQQSISKMLVSTERYPCLLMQQTRFEV